MKRFYLPATLAVALLFTSCGTSARLTSNHNVFETNVELSQKNFEIKRGAQGSARASYVFGIGGLSRRAIRSNAQAQMLRDANLQGSEMIINPTVEVKHRGFVPFYLREQVTVSGYVIEFTK